MEKNKAGQGIMVVGGVESGVGECMEKWGEWRGVAFLYRVVYSCY